MFRQFCPEKTLSTLETWAYFWNCPEGAACYNTRLQKWLQTFSRTFPAKSPDNVQVSSCDTTAGNTHRTINHVQPCAAPWTWTALTVHSPTPVTPPTPPTPPLPLMWTAKSGKLFSGVSCEGTVFVGPAAALWLVQSPHCPSPSVRLARLHDTHRMARSNFEFLL